MNENFKKFRKELENKTPEELEQGYNNFINAIKILPIDYEESMKELAKVRGKSENHYLNTEEKNLYIVNYKYKLLEILDEEYETDTILIKAWDNKDVHKYMDKYRQEFIDCGYDMQYSFQKVGEGNFVEV